MASWSDYHFKKLYQLAIIDKWKVSSTWALSHSVNPLIDFYFAAAIFGSLHSLHGAILAPARNCFEQNSISDWFV